MTETAVRIQKLGGSLMVIIPKNIVLYEGFHEGETIHVSLKKKSTSLLGAFPQLGPWEKEDPSVHSKYA